MRRPSDSVSNGSVRDEHDRSRVQLASGDAHRPSVPRIPNMEDVTTNTRRLSRSLVLEPGPHAARNRETGGAAVERESSRGRPIIHQRRRTSGRGERFQSLPPRSARSTVSGRSNREYEDFEDDIYVVPALPMPVAVLCCVLNFIIPGFGSMVAAVCLLCCGKTEDMSCKEKCGSCLTVFGIGVLQLVLVVCFLIGWIWSCIWGVTFIGMSATYYDEEDDERERELAERPHENTDTGSQQRRALPTPQVVEDQPFPGVRYEDIRRDRYRQRRREPRSRQTRSRMVITPSTLIYPMRAPSNIIYNSPPPTYQESENDRRRRSTIVTTTDPTLLSVPGNHEVMRSEMSRDP